MSDCLIVCYHQPFFCCTIDMYCTSTIVNFIVLRMIKIAPLNPNRLTLICDLDLLSRTLLTESLTVFTFIPNMKPISQIASEKSLFLGEHLTLICDLDLDQSHRHLTHQTSLVVLYINIKYEVYKSNSNWDMVYCVVFWRKKMTLTCDFDHQARSISPMVTKLLSKVKH